MKQSGRKQNEVQQRVEQIQREECRIDEIKNRQNRTEENGVKMEANLKCMMCRKKSTIEMERKMCYI